MSARTWEEQPGLVDPKSWYEGFAEGEKKAAEEIKRLRAAQEGMVLVPREPTEAMMLAGSIAWPDMYDARATYQAMIAAAQEKPDAEAP